MSPKLRTFVVTTVLCLIGLSVFAQKAPPPPDSKVPLPGLVLPIDDNLIVLILAGILAGLFYYYKAARRTRASKAQ